MPARRCPTDPELDAFLAENVQPDLLPPLEQHLATCSKCRTRLVELRRNRGTPTQSLSKKPEPPVREINSAEPSSEEQTENVISPLSDGAGDDAGAPVGAVIPAAGPISPLAEKDVRDLLRQRLLAAAVVGFIVQGGLALLQVSGLDPAPEAGARPLGLAFLTLGAAASASAWLRLRLRPPGSLQALRWIELALFALPLSWLGYNRYALLVDARHLEFDGMAHQALYVQFAALRNNVQWCCLLLGYGLLIPNVWQRCVAVVAVISAALLGVTVTAGLADPVTRGQLPVLLTVTVLLLAAVGPMAVYGSFKLSTLQREAAAARQLGQYRLRRRLGAGGMGEVFLAEHRLLKRPCALKLIRPERAGDPDVIRRFEREVKAMARLTHFNAVEIFDYGRTREGTFFYVMEYLEGPTLEDLVLQSGRLPAARAVHFLRQLCGALHEAHSIGLIHRDVKPGNVLVCRHGGLSDVVKLLDFGLVRHAGPTEAPRLTQDRVVMGTPEYISPEQAQGSAALDARCDLYSLGAVGYFLLTGRPPFVGGSAVEKLFAHMHKPPKAPRSLCPEVPEDVERVVLRCLAKAPDDRYPSAWAVEDALARCGCAGHWTQADAATSLTTTKESHDRNLLV